MAETRCKYYKQKRQVSYDGGQTWQDVIPYQYQRGELYEYESADCGALVVYRWVNMDSSVDYYCEGTTKYYKQKKQVSYDGGQTWIDVSPAEYQRGGVAEQRSTDCGYVPPTPQYKWIKSDDTLCVETQYRWVNMDASVDYYCEGTTKYYKQKKQVSYDGSQTWQDVTPAEYQKGGVAEEQSTDCGYVSQKFVATYPNGKTREIDCNDNPTLVYDETRPHVYEYSMTSAVIGKCVTAIGGKAFYGCGSLTSIVIPDSVTSFDNEIFWFCRGLTSVTLSNRLTTIGDIDFSECTALKRVNSDVDGVCNIPDSVITIGQQAFNHCSGITDVRLGHNITSIGNRAFNKCTSLTSITIPDSVTEIGYQVFQGCSGLTSIDIPSGVTSINNAVFQSCYNLKRVNSSVDGVYNIPSNVTTIGGYAFSGCRSLTSINIPNSVTTIGDNVFQYCSGLTSVTVNSTTPPTLGVNIFYNVYHASIYVPAQSVNTYKTAEGWSDYADSIFPIP